MHDECLRRNPNECMYVPFVVSKNWNFAFDIVTEGTKGEKGEKGIRGLIGFTGYKGDAGREYLFLSFKPYVYWCQSDTGRKDLLCHFNRILMSKVNLLCYIHVYINIWFMWHTRVIQNVLLCTKYYVISKAYPYLVYSNLFRKISWTKAQFNQSRDLLS